MSQGPRYASALDALVSQAVAILSAPLLLAAEPVKGEPTPERRAVAGVPGPIGKSKRSGRGWVKTRKR